LSSPDPDRFRLGLPSNLSLFRMDGY